MKAVNMRTVKKMAVLGLMILATGFTPNKAQALDLVMLVPDLVMRMNGHDAPFFSYTVHGSEYIVGRVGIADVITALVLFPLALADAPADAIGALEAVDVKLAEQGYSSEEIANYNSDMTTVIGPALNGKKLSVDEFKAAVKAMDIHESTREAIMVE